MAYNYVVTNQKPTAVTHALTAAFTAPDALNLLLIRSTRLEVHTMGPEGLVPVGRVGGWVGGWVDVCVCVLSLSPSPSPSVGLITSLEARLMTGFKTHPPTHPPLPSQVLDVRLYGRISTASILKLPNEAQDVLFLSTERYVSTLPPTHSIESSSAPTHPPTHPPTYP